MATNPTNVYRRLINSLQLQASSADNYAGLYLMLAMLGDAEALNSSTDVLGNDVDECLRRMSAYANTRGFANVKSLLNQLRERGGR